MYGRRISKNEVINLVMQHIEDCKHIKNSGMYSSMMLKDIHDEKYETVIDELEDLLEDIKLIR